MPTRNINLTPALDRFVKRHLKSGRYGNASEVVREALRLLEQKEREREAKLKALSQAVQEGVDELDQGKGIVLKGKKAIDKFFKEIEEEVLSAARRKR